MRNIVVTEMITLDGVMQGPNDHTEDARDGFQRGGWAPPFEDQVKGKAMAKEIAKGRPLLLGRRTYEHFFKAWHGRTDGNPFTEVLDKTPKYVVSNSLRTPLQWENSTLLQGNVQEVVRRLKEEPGKDLVILGSGELVRSLMLANLIDEYLLLIHPIVLGQGKRLFPDHGVLCGLKVAESWTTTTGVLIVNYRLDEAAATNKEEARAS